MILGLNGLKGSGKDTVAAYLIKEHGFERRAFFDAPKRSVATMLDIPYHEIDRWKNDPNVHVEVVQYADDDAASKKDGNFAFIDGPGTFREFLQRYGDALKEAFGENILMDNVLPIDGYYYKRNIAITDLRFEFEARRVNICGGLVVHIKRDNASKDQHSSEQPLPAKLVDYELINDSTFEVLYDRIELMLTELNSLESRVRKVLG